MMAIWKCHANYVHCVKLIVCTAPAVKMESARICRHIFPFILRIPRVAPLRNYLDIHIGVYIIQLTYMKHSEASKPKRPFAAKAEVLRRQGALHPHPDAVHDKAFRQGEFFDARDLVQVRYEMLRRHQVEGRAVTEVADAFGVSRQAFYTTEAAFARMGISGLLPRQRGPKRAHKCTEEILDFVEQQRTGLPEEDITAAIQKRFGVAINPRSIERALTRRKKKR